MPLAHHDTTDHPPIDRSFGVMSSPAYVQVHGGTEEMADWAVARLQELERLWSRFLPDSDITRANQAAGTAVPVHPDTQAVVARGIEAWRQTGGLFDITMLADLLRMGYTNSIVDNAPAPKVNAHRTGTTPEIVVDYAAGTLMVPSGSGIDLGGIGKGMAADIVAEELIEAGATGAVVNVGGDLVVLGTPATDLSWLLGIENPLEPPHHVAHLRVVRGGAATSGTSQRHWTGDDGSQVHHIVHPTRHRSSNTDVVAATVLAADAATAEAFSTAVMMGDRRQGIELVERVGLAALLVCDDGEILRSSTLEDFEA
ncbi:MAG: FAD:protein FMN transferase [Actinomycetota bacterium]